MKSIYTTGEAAKICGLSQGTIIKCFDKGLLKGFRTPTSGKFRMITRSDIMDYMEKYDIPMNRLLEKNELLDYQI